MIAYRLLRALGRLALRWFYRDIELVGGERIPATGPVLLASNHPNALVDALVVGCTLRRPVTLTAKATLLENPLTRWLLRIAGVVPLRRVSDAVARAPGATVDPARNAMSFEAVLDILQHGGVVLLFPEGKSHSDPSIAPLKTGLARIAIMARENRHIHSLSILPVGLTFEQKWEPRSRVVMHIGPPIDVDSVPNGSDGIALLTNHVDSGLRRVTLNFETADEAKRIWSVSTLLAEVLAEFGPLHSPDPPLAESVRLAQRISSFASSLPDFEPALVARIEVFLERVAAFEQLVGAHGIPPSDVRMSTAVAPGAWFAAREVAIALVAGPLALWGRLNHWIPVRLARALAKRTSHTPDEPAMNTIVAGLIFVLVFYAAQTALVAWALGGVAAVIYAASLPLSASWDFKYADRRRRSVARIRTYFTLRRDPTLHQRLLAETTYLRGEALALGVELDRAVGRDLGTTAVREGQRQVSETRS